VAIAGDYAYVADFAEGLLVIDVTDPSNPFEVGSVDTPFLGWSVAVSGGFAYVVEYYFGLRVIDVSDPSTPFVVGSFEAPFPSVAIDVAVTGSYAYLAALGGGVRVIDVGDPSSPMEVGLAYTPDIANGVAVAAGHVYVTDERAGLFVFRDCLVFSDSFESGDTSAWSAMVP
jgi:hypothetical protein